MAGVARCVDNWPIVFEQALFKITCNASVVNRLVCVAHQNINVNEIFHLAGLPSRSLWSAEKEVKRARPPSLCYGVAAFASSRYSKAKAGPARIRTWDQGIMSPLLLPLSYRPILLMY